MKIQDNTPQVSPANDTVSLSPEVTKVLCEQFADVLRAHSASLGKDYANAQYYYNDDPDWRVDIEPKNVEKVMLVLKQAATIFETLVQGGGKT